MKSSSICLFSFEMGANLVETLNTCSVLKPDSRGCTHLKLSHFKLMCTEVVFLPIPHLEIIYFQEVYLVGL